MTYQKCEKCKQFRTDVKVYAVDVRDGTLFTLKLCPPCAEIRGLVTPMRSR